MAAIRRWIIPFYMALCIMLGGASAAGVLPNLLLQLGAIALLVWMLRRPAPGRAKAVKALAALGLVGIGVVLLTLIPLPPGLWSALPGREGVANGYALLDVPLPWLPLSLDPTATIASALALLPAFAVLLGMSRPGVTDPRPFAWAVVGLACLSIIVGLVQVVGGLDSPAYFYRITNRGSSVGFFANSNHLATLLVISLPIVTALYLSARDARQDLQRRSAMYVLFVGIGLVLIAGILINLSVAGFALGAVSLLASAAMIVWDRRKVPLWVPCVALLVCGGAIAVSATGDVSAKVESWGEAEISIGRYSTFTNSLNATGEYFPVGSGLGTFRDIYPMFEDANAVTTTYVNHVHNDYIEFALEMGIAGIALIGLFLAWWVRMAIRAWRQEGPGLAFARAATIATAAVIVHSFVDYPLRTAAIAAVFMGLCAIMGNPAWRSGAKPASRREAKARHLSV